MSSDLPTAQLLGLLNTMLRNLTKSLRAAQEQAVAKALESAKKGEYVNSVSQNGKMVPLSMSLNSELEEAEKELQKKQKSELDKLKGHLDFQQYAIKGNDEQWKEALTIKDQSRIDKLKMVSVKTAEKRPLQDQTLADENSATEGFKKKKKKFKDKSRKDKMKT